MGPIFSLTVTNKSLSITSEPLARLPKTKEEDGFIPHLSPLQGHCLSLFLKHCLSTISFIFLKWETSTCSSTYLCINWLILVCALTRDWTRNLGILGPHSNQLNHLARAYLIYLNVPSWSSGSRINPLELKSHFSSSVALGKWFNFSELQCLHLYNEGNNRIYLWGDYSI